MSNNTNQILLRSKFKNLLTDEQSTNSTLLGTFERFQQTDSDNALSMLWHLTCKSNYASIVFERFGLEFGCVATEQLRNEMRYQYSRIHPEFLKIEIESEEIQKAFDSLKNKTDLIVSAVVYQHCHSKMSLSDDEISRIDFLLASDTENYFFGGIRTLGFDIDETTYLKPFHEEIHNLFSSLYEEKHSVKNFPFEEVQKLLNNTSDVFSAEEQIDLSISDQVKASENILDKQAVDDLPEENLIQNQNNLIGASFRPLTVEEILKNRYDFLCFIRSTNLTYLEYIRKAGFDLNQVIEKRVQISNLFEAIQALENY